MNGVWFGLGGQCGKIRKEFVIVQNLANSFSFFLILVTHFGWWCFNGKYEPCVMKPWVEPWSPFLLWKYHA